MSQPITISFVGTQALKDILQRWAEKDDRSVSYIIRQILEKEIQRRRGEGEINGKEMSNESKYASSEV